MKKYDTTTKHYSTSDLNLGSALLAAKFQLVAVDKIDGKRYQFSFDYSERLGEVINQFWLRQLQLNVSDLFEAREFLKNCTYHPPVIDQRQ